MPQKDPAARAAYQKAYREAHREQKRQASKASYDRHRDEIQARRRERVATMDDQARALRSQRNRQYTATYRRKHAATIAERQARLKREEPDRVRQYAARYREQHREEIRQRRRAAYAADPEPERRRGREATIRARLARGLPPTIIRMSQEGRTARKRAWRLANAERVREQDRRSKHARRAQIAAYLRATTARRARYARAWQEAHRDRRRDQQRARYQANPAKYRAWAMRYHAKKKGLTIGPIDHQAIVARDRGVCQICSEPVAERDRSFDHIIPISANGPHVQWNLRLTHLVCNQRRGPGRIPAQIYLPL